ncbi:DNA ligase [Campylobacter blaseri]|uniref:DNA ligase n=1 Tax=Campylobacter blaseri TaxID=2042961 RepID=A0A2P8R1F6_9BACT|nr:DNA ligase [Campylobacter blaseri]PSM52329.1 DNA ligase [Campylobacter blaseri]PSM54095.1 DNA ligase [Campylobacter blaseri]QKF85537.1 DNA ligase [Campylobacter blaseri]
MFRFIISIFFSFLTLFAQKPNVMLLNEYNNENLSGWYMSEKLDGVRARWNGKELVSRNGNKFSAPKDFIKDFPSFSLDGELFTKRGDFANISSITSQLIPHNGWSEIKFYIFDIPDLNESFDIKYKKMQEISKNSKNIVFIEQKIVKNNEEVFEFLDEVVSKGGEGVVVREPSLIYENARSNRILKLKKFKDSECKVVAINKGNGKYKDKMGSITCEKEDGVRFKIGTGFNDEIRENPPKIGDIITYKYQNLTKKGIPRFAVFLRIRDEI